MQFWSGANDMIYYIIHSLGIININKCLFTFSGAYLRSCSSDFRVLRLIWYVLEGLIFVTLNNNLTLGFITYILYWVTKEEELEISLSR